MERIRTERIAIRSLPNESGKLSNDDNSLGHEYNNKYGDKKSNNSRNIEIDEIDKLLEELKKSEPTSDNLFFRLAIIAYEIGDLNKAVVYAERFKNDEKIRVGHLANGKIALADILTQLYLLCISMGWDFHKLRKLGAERLEERHEDFKKNGWCDIK